MSEGPNRPEADASEGSSGAKSARVPVLDHLRGLAALSVCVYHFTKVKAGFISEEDPIRWATAHGWLGVEVFFVISGFVIPYSLYRRSYRLRDAGRFFVRRLQRLEPPYLACIALILVLNVLLPPVPEYDGSWKFNLPQLLAHLGYLNAVLDLGWLNPVFWTLAIEFQFYIFIAIVFPLLVHQRLLIRMMYVVGFAGLGLLGEGNSALLPQWLPLFAIGMVTFQHYVGALSLKWFIATFLVVSWISFDVLGAPATIVGIATALVIRLCASRELPRVLMPLTLVGTISYSLYLLHIPIGLRIIEFATLRDGEAENRYLTVAIALAASITSAWLFWWLVERPSHAWARSTRVSRAEPKQ